VTPPTLPRLIVITDWTLPRTQLLSALEQVCSLGPRVAVQHRAPGLPARRFLEEARRLRALTAPHRVPLFINGRLDVALLVEAHLHLPASGPLPGDVRPHLPQGRLVSVAVHDEEEAARAGGADLALVSPVFSPSSKPLGPRAPLGPEGLGRLAGHLGCPAYALGGVSPGTLGALPGVAGVAVVGAVLCAPHPLSVAEALLGHSA
jgi:thiamine-phosphate pyrophosphorylase